MRGTRVPRGPRMAVAAACVAILGACAAPAHTFVASPDADLVVRLPSSWNTVRNEASKDATTGQPDGSWNAVFDASKQPDSAHVDLSTSVNAPVAYARVINLDSDTASGMNGDKLRDLVLPFTAAAREQVASDSRAKTFKRISDYDVHSSVASGVHVVYSYDLGHGREVFDQIAMVASQQTRVYLLVVRCDQACYDAHKNEIADVVSSFTVKVP